MVFYYVPGTVLRTLHISTNPVNLVLFISEERREGTERLRNLPRIVQLVSGRARLGEE